MDRTQSRRDALTDRPNRIESLVREARRAHRRAAVSAAALRWLGVWLAAVLAAMALDAVVGLPAAGLILLDGLLVALGITGAARVVRIAARPHSDEAVARELEREAGLERSELINALHLARAGGGGSAALRNAAVKLGEQSAGSVSPKLLMDRLALRRGAIVAGIAAGIGLIGLFLPGVYNAVFPRLLSPTADRPPFTLLRFDAEVEPAPVLYGQPATVRVAIDGPTRLPERVELVLDPTDEHPPQTVRMLQATRDTDAKRKTNAFTVRFARAEVDRTFYIDTPQGRSRRYRLEVHPVPRIEHAEVVYAYPKYTGWPDAEQPLSEQGLRGIVGTTATLKLRSSLPLKGGALAFLPEPDDASGQEESRASTASSAPHAPPRTADLVISEDDPTRATLRWPIEESGRFRIDLVGADGTPSNDPLEGRVTAVPDEAPRITVREPAPRVVAPVDWTVDATFLATDDVGLGGVTLRRSINGWGPALVNLDLDATDLTGRRATARDRFDLASLGVVEGDVITFSAVVRDNLPGSPQTDETELLSVEVISTERYLELQRKQYRVADMKAEWERFRVQLDQLAETRESLLEEMEAMRAKVASGEPLTEAQRMRMRELSEQLEDYRSQSLDLAEALYRRTERATLYEFENPYKEMLRRVSQELEAQAQYAGEAQRRSRPFQPGQAPPSEAAQREMLEAAQAFRQRQDPFTAEERRAWEQADVDLDKLRWADAMRAAGERIRQVAREQEELAERLAAFRLQEQLTPAETLQARRLAEQQATLQAELASALTDLRQAAEEARPHLPTMSSGAMRVCERAEAMEITGDQADAARLAQAGAGRYAYDAADAAARKLDSLLTDGSGMANMQNSEGLDGCFSLPRENLQQALDQMAQSRGIPGLGSGQTGQSGYGMYGSTARMALVGPAQRSGGDSDAESGTPGPGAGRGPGRGAAAGGGEPVETQRVDPDSARVRSGSLSLIPGVPPEYRDEAEAYFRRLADDSSP